MDHNNYYTNLTYSAKENPLLEQRKGKDKHCF